MDTKADTHKNIATEKILRKITTIEALERPFSKPVKPKQRRQSPILRKCEDLMEALWEDGYHNEIPWHTLRDYVVSMCGGFRTTVTDYLGKREVFYKSRGRQGVLKCPAKKGYLEWFNFVSLKSPRIVNLHHENVQRRYHCKQSDIVSFSLSNCSMEGMEAERPYSNDKNNNTKRERN